MPVIQPTGATAISLPFFHTAPAAQEAGPCCVN